MGACFSLCGRCLMLFKKKGAEYEKLEILSQGGSPKASGGGGSSSGVQDADDGEFADWDEEASAPLSVAIAPMSSPAVALARAKQLASTEETPPPPPEPDFFGNLGMSIGSVQVTRVAAKKPLASSVAAAAAAAVASSNAHSSRFTDDLVEEAPLTSAATASWGDDDLDGLLGNGGGGTNAPGGRKPRGVRDPVAKKPRGIGAVAVALDDDV